MKKIISAAAAVILSVSPLVCSAEEVSTPASPVLEQAQETLSAVGSVSKTFTAAAALQLAEEGKLDIDKPVTEYLPEFKMADGRYKDITVRMLMDHTAGFMGFTVGNAMVFDDIITEEHDKFLERLSIQRLKADPGTIASYSNDGFTLLELVVERVSGMSYTDYIEENICSPLGLEQTGTPLKNYGQPNTAKVFLNGRTEFAPDYAMAFGSGGIYSTASELCRYGASFFKGDETLLTEKSKSEMNKSNARDKYDDGFGLSWDMTGMDCYDKAGVKVVIKGGNTIYQNALLMVAPDEKISISVLSSGKDGSSSGDFGMALLDTVLEDRGIHVEHSEPQKMTLLDTVPEEYLSKADIYANSDGIVSVAFPEGRYMEITDITSDNPKPMQFKYSSEGFFVLMSGEIGSGSERQADDSLFLSFSERDGEEYICSDSNKNIEGFFRYESSEYYLQRTGANKVSGDIIGKWEERSGKKYYLCDALYSNGGYLGNPSVRLMTAEGYVFGKLPDRSNMFASAVTDGENALGFVKMSGSKGGNLRDIRIDTADGHEMLNITNCALSFIEEDAIDDFTSDIHSVSLETGRAKWYNIGSMGGKSVTLDICGKASVYVYDEYDNVIYSSFMKGFGSEITFPENGKIVFAGENGAKVDIG